MSTEHDPPPGEAVAVVGLAVRLPGAADVPTFWANLRDGVDSVSRFSPAELVARGCDPDRVARAGFVGAEGVLDDIDLFDAELFGIAPREAQITDPQHRIGLELAWDAFVTSGHRPGREDGRVGVYLSCSMSTYLVRNLLPNRELMDLVGGFGVLTHNDKDFLAATVSHHLGLAGPSMTVGTACSSSLVGVHLAIQALQSGECDLALAGGVSVQVPQPSGYVHSPDGIYSRDGRCAAFDDAASGTVGGSGGAMVLLRRLEDARRDGDHVHAVLLGSAVNNDGGEALGFAAPGVDGQRDVIVEALSVADVRPRELGYVEAHGTGTRLGDAVEVAALCAAFATDDAGRGRCALGSVKSNVGHLDAAAGAAGLVKAVLAVEHGVVPPTLHVDRPSTEIGFERTPFFLPTGAGEWPDTGSARTAGVSSFGVGGTNAHVVIGQAPTVGTPPAPAASEEIPLPLSAPSHEQLVRVVDGIADLIERTGPDLRSVGRSLAGRPEFAHRRVVRAANPAEAVTRLRTPGPDGAPGTELARLAESWCRGGPVAWDRRPELAGAVRVPLPGHPFRSVRHWADTPARPGTPPSAVPSAAASARSLLAGVSGDDAPKDPDRVPGLRDGLDALCAALLAEYLGIRPDGPETAAAELAADLGVRASYRPFLDWMLHVLAEDGVVRHTAAGRYRPAARTVADAAELADDLVRRFPAWAGLIRSVRHCADGYRDGFAARGAGLAVLRPPGDEDRIPRALAEQTVPHSWVDPMTDVLVSLVHGRGVADRPMDVLEIGAGDGRLTAKLAERLLPLGVRLDVTDVSAAPLSRLEHAARSRGYDGVRVFRLDVTRSPDEQGCRPDGYDAVVGVDVLHAVPDVASTMRTLPSLLRPGGLLALVESVRPRRWTTMIWGLTEQWWGATDGRRNGPLLDPDRWRALLAEHGPPASDVVDVGDAALLLAERPAAARTDGWPGRLDDVERWTYRQGWRQDAPPSDVSGAGRTVLALVAGPVGRGVAARLRERGATVIEVEPADGAAAGPGRRVGADDEAAHEHLLADLERQGWHPDLVVQAWNAEHGPPATPDTVDESQRRGLHHLLLLARTLGRRTRPVRVVVVTSGAADVLGTELTHPERATVAAAVKIVPREYPDAVWMHLDLPADPPESILRAAALESLAGRRGPVVALRGDRRWVPEVRPYPLPARTPRIGPGPYLVCGGLGGLGLPITEYLVRSGATVVATRRRPLSLRGGPADGAEVADGPDGAIVRRLLDAERDGGRALVESVDVTDRSAMAELVERIGRDHGPLRGVVHAAGIPDRGGVVQRRTAGDTDVALAAKLHGGLVLDDLLADTDLDFFVLCSSLATVLHKLKYGEVGYVAGNEFLEALAARRRAGGRAAVTIGWTDWTDAGMWVRARGELSDRYRAASDGELLSGVTEAEGIDRFAAILADGAGPGVLVCTQDLVELLARHDDFTVADHRREAGRLERPTGVADAGAGPRAGEDVPATLRRWCAELLGLPTVSATDDFFELGGDSLLGLRLLSFVDDHYGVNVPAGPFFDRPTMATLAGLVAEGSGGTDGGPGPQATVEVLL